MRLETMMAKVSTSGDMFVDRGATKDNVIFQYNFFSNLDDLGYGVIDIGNYLSLIFLNSGHTQLVAGTQTTWLQSVLSERQGKNILPFFMLVHIRGITFTGVTKQVRDWTPLFTQYGVKVTTGHVSLVITGNSLDENGVVYIGQGFGMGNTTRGTNCKCRYMVC